MVVLEELERGLKIIVIGLAAGTTTTAAAASSIGGGSGRPLDLAKYSQLGNKKS